MPLENISLSEILNAPVINPGLGGWDAVINNHLADSRGRHRYGLLSKIVNYNGTPDPINLIVVPAGWICAVSQVLIVPEGSADPGDSLLQFGWDSQTIPDNWLPGAGSSAISLTDLSVASGQPVDCLMIAPFPGATVFPPSLPANPPSLPAVPLGNGDVETGPNSRYFTMDTTGGAWTGSVHISTFGSIWLKDDI